MNRSRKVLLVGGLLLTLWGMGYGLYYALLDEHPTLEFMGERLATGFAHAAEGEMAQAHAALDAYAQKKYEYVREVDVHSHWTGLAMLLILLGVIFDHVAFDERRRVWLAVLLVAASALFPLGVILQTVDRGLAPQLLAAASSGILVLALGAVAVGFARGGRR
ncbi:MAG: hypothetical protein ACE5G6_07515 [Terriglobia bacterium]